MNAKVFVVIRFCVLVLCSSAGLSGCVAPPPPPPSLTVAPANPVAPGAPVQVCYALPAGTQAAFIAPSLAGEPAFHDITDTATACATVRERRTTRYTLEVVSAQGAAVTLQATIAIKVPPPVVVPPKPTAVVTAVEAVANGDSCPTSIDVKGGIALRKGGPVTYHILLNGRTSGANDVVRVPAGGNLSIADRLPFPSQTKATAAIAITAPARYASRTLSFNIPCPIQHAAQIAIWKLASSVRCQPGSGFPGAGCARTVNHIIAEALGHSIPPGAPPFYCGGLSSNGVPWDPQARHACMTTWVPDIVQMIEEHPQFGEPLRRDETVPGDIAVQDGTNPQRGMNHIGFCEDAGCLSVLSNESSTGRLCGETNATMSDNGYPYSPDYPPTFYRVYGVAQAIR